MTETSSTPTHKPRPPGPGQCPVCHRDLWEPCLQCRQTGLQGPGIVWCPECRQPGRGERCDKCGAKLHAPPLCIKCGGLGWLPIHHACLPEAHTSTPPTQPPPRQPESEPPYKPGSTAIELPGGLQAGRTQADTISPAPPLPPDEEDEAVPPPRVGALRAVLIIIVILLFVGYASCYWWAWF